MSNSMPIPFDIRFMNLIAGTLLLAFAGLALGVAVSWAVQHPAVSIRGVTVTGDVEHTNAVTLRAHVTPRMNGTFLTVDLGQTRQAFEAVPWVRRAVVQREFPNRLKVVLQEHRASGYWGVEGESSLINSHGEVFEANAGEVEQDMLPRLNGPRAQSAQVLAMYEALHPLFDGVNLSVELLELTGRGGWRVQLDTGAEIELGRGDVTEVTERTRRFVSTMTQVSSRYGRTAAALEAADLRYPDGYAIRLRGVSTVVQEKLKK